MVKNNSKGRKPFYATKEAFIKDITRVSNNICKGMAPTVTEMASAIKKSPMLVQNYVKKYGLDNMFANSHRGRQSAFKTCENFKKTIAKAAKKYSKTMPSISDIVKTTGLSETTIRKYAESFDLESMLSMTKRTIKKETGMRASLKPGNRIVGMTAENFKRFLEMVTIDLGRKPTLAEATAYLNKALAANGCTVEKNPSAVSFYAHKYNLCDMMQSCRRGRKDVTKNDINRFIGGLLK